MAPKGTTEQPGLSRPTLEEVFRLRLEHIEARAAAVGGMTSLCEEVGASPYTPRRWRSKTPYTILLVDKLEQALVAREEMRVKEERARLRKIESKMARLAELQASQQDDPTCTKLRDRIARMRAELDALWKEGGD